MRITPARAVSIAAIDHCLSAVHARDPLSVPSDFCDRDLTTAVVALDDEGVLGVGWVRSLHIGDRIEVRVAPGHRRQGVGSALFTRLERPDRPLLATCDAAQIRTRRFLESRRFELTDVVFVQRWDGALDDVPATFRTAELTEVDDYAAAARLLEAASIDSWPPPLFDEAILADPGTRVRVARVGARPVGICAARGDDDTWTVGGLAVLPDARGRGVGRALICDLMSAAAEDGVGVTLRISHGSTSVLNWTRGLGFWTCRSWVCYQRQPLPTSRRSA